MRQIDADLLQEELENEIELSKRKGERGIRSGLRIAARRVKHAPAIEAVPLDRLGDFGKLFMDYEGCPRGAMGRACMPIEEEVLMMKPITDVDGGRWIPVNADALHELVKKYASLRDNAAQPVVININEKVKVKLSDVGKDIYYHRFDAYNSMAKPIGIKLLEPTMPKVDADGYSCFQLWELMETYGPHIGICRPVPFDCDILFRMDGDPHDSGQ